jgi:hypothetical protein
MATYQAVAAVTAVLVHLISEEVAGLELGNYNVAAKPPKDTRNDADADKTAVHVYLYRVTENAVWRNDDLPLRSQSGSLLQRPRLALNLHYLISCYGKDADYVPPKLLGAIASLFQRKPILTTDLLTEAGRKDDDLQKMLDAARLIAEVEKVKLSLTTLDIEELSKLWSVLLQVPYALSLTYEASVVFIEPDVEPVAAQPVQTRRIDVQAGGAP